MKQQSANLAAIETPVMDRNAPDYPNVITGTLHGSEIIVRRRFRGWEGMLQIFVNGVQIHDAPATEKEKLEFTRLHGRAREAEADAQDLAKVETLKSKAFRALFPKS